MANRFGRSVRRLNEALVNRGVDTGIDVMDEGSEELMEAYADMLRMTSRELEDLSWQALNNSGGVDRQDPRPEQRLRLVERARTAWRHDPQAGAVTSLMNDFVLGRGIPVPRCKDELVQKVVDDLFADPDNKRVLTTFGSQVALNTDLTLQDNLYVLAFDDGKDGKFKLGLLQHDLVRGVVRDPENYLRILYYVAREETYEWDFQSDAPKPNLGQPKSVYYEAYGAVEEAEAERNEAPSSANMQPLQKPPPEKLRRGKVYHVAMNRTTEMAFGFPEFARSIRWMSAQNDLLAARVDMAKAVASLIMKRKIKGSPTQLARTAAKYLSRESPLAAVQGMTGGPIPAGPAPASMVEENENSTLEPFNLDSRAGNAQMDVRMIGGQVSAAHRFPRSYLGDQMAGSLATATSLELPVLRAVEARQEVLEQLVRWFVDAGIQKAVDDGKIPKALTDEELAAKAKVDQIVLDIAGVPSRWEGQNGNGATPAGQPSFGDPMTAAGMGQLLSALQEAGWESEVSPDGSKLILTGAGYEGASDDEADTLRDLSYDFTLPSPLRRQLPELISACVQVVEAFDPDNTNVELSRALLSIALSEALEVADAADIVERVFPPGYKTMAQKQFELQQQGAAGAAGTGRPSPFGPEAQGQPFPKGDGGEQIAAGPDGRPPNARMNARPAEKAYPQLQQALLEALSGTGMSFARRRDGGYILFPGPPVELEEGLPVVNGDLPDLPEDVEAEVRGDTREELDEWDRDVVSVAVEELTRATATPTNE